MNNNSEFTLIIKESDDMFKGVLNNSGEYVTTFTKPTIFEVKQDCATLVGVNNFSVIYE